MSNGVVVVPWSRNPRARNRSASGRPWTQAEVFGLAPDPTAIGTLGWLLLLQGCRDSARGLLRTLWLVPLAWCAISAATLATMGEWQALVPLVAPLLALLALLAARRG